MSGEWVTKSLGEVVSLQRGHDLPTQVRGQGGVPIMGSAGITGFHDKAKDKGPGVVIGRSGNAMGEVHFTNNDYWPLNTCLYVTDFKGNNPKFVYYLLKTINFDQFNSGSAQKSLNRNAVYPFQVYLPESIEDQKKIANILTSIEDKIALNRQINQTLEAMAQALFKSWFVDFEPVRARISALETGEDPTCAAMRAISGKIDAELGTLQTTDPDAYAQLHTTASLFPNELVDSELGPVPEGWEVGIIGDIAKAKGGYAFKSTEFIDKGLKVIKIKNINNNGTVDVSDCDYVSINAANKAQKFEIKSGRLLMAMTGATVGKSGLFVSEQPAYLNQRVAFFESILPGINIDNFLFCLFRRESVYEQVIGSAQGSAQPNISSNGIEATKILIAEVNAIKRFAIIVNTIFEQRTKRILENRTLTDLRDTLLPKLLSGELELNHTDY